MSIALPAEKCRAAFLQECRHTLPSIMGRDDARKSSLLDRQAVVDRRIHTAMYGRQRCGQRKRRLCSECLRQLDSLPEQIEAGHYAVDQTKARRLGCVECSSSQDQLDGGLPADVSG